MLLINLPSKTNLHRCLSSRTKKFIVAKILLIDQIIKRQVSPRKKKLFAQQSQAARQQLLNHLSESERRHHQDLLHKLQAGLICWQKSGPCRKNANILLIIKFSRLGQARSGYSPYYTCRLQTWIAAFVFCHERRTHAAAAVLVVSCTGRTKCGSEKRQKNVSREYQIASGADFN